MALLTDAEARNEIMGALNTAWLAGGASAAVALGFEDTTFVRPVGSSDVTVPYGYAFIRKVLSEQATLSSEDGLIRWRTKGTVNVQVRTPQGDGYTLSTALCAIARDAFRGTRTPGGVVFSRPRIREAGTDGAYTLANVIADFEFDEVT